VVSGLDVNDISFASSPPYFESGPDDDVEENVLGQLGNLLMGGTVLQVKCITCCIFASPHFAFILITW
jgi:hypothetical protein